jgi:hypothetical protein
MVEMAVSLGFSEMKLDIRKYSIALLCSPHIYLAKYVGIQGRLGNGICRKHVHLSYDKHLEHLSL